MPTSPARRGGRGWKRTSAAILIATAAALLCVAVQGREGTEAGSGEASRVCSAEGDGEGCATEETGVDTPDDDSLGMAESEYPTDLDAAASTSSPALELLLAPKTVDEFFEMHFEQTPLRVSGAWEQQTQRTDILTMTAFQQAFTRPEVCEAAELVVSDGTVGRGGKVVSDDPDVLALNEQRDGCVYTFDDAYEAGATILIPEAQRYFDSLGSLACSLQQNLLHSVSINLYYTPPRSTGFLWHHDAHDLFIVQAAGNKRWDMCVPTSLFDRLPIKGKHYGSAFVSDSTRHKCRNITLSAGQTLYLPRGTLHAPQTLGQPSLHLSIGVDVRSFRWIDLLLAHLRFPHLFDRCKSCDAGSYSNLTHTVFHDAEFGNVTWAALLAAMASRLADDVDLPVSLIARRAFPLHLFVEGTHNLTAYATLNSSFEELVKKTADVCSDMLVDVTAKFLRRDGHADAGGPEDPAQGAEDLPAYIGAHCSEVIRSAFPLSSFKFMSQTLVSTALSRWLEKCLQT